MLAAVSAKLSLEKNTHTVGLLFKLFHSLLLGNSLFPVLEYSLGACTPGDRSPRPPSIADMI